MWPIPLVQAHIVLDGDKVHLSAGIPGTWDELQWLAADSAHRPVDYGRARARGPLSGDTKPVVRISRIKTRLGNHLTSTPLFRG